MCVSRPRCHSGIVSALCFVLAFEPTLVEAASSRRSPPPPAEPEVAVNRKVPKVDPPPRELTFSRFPSDDEIAHARVLPGPVLPLAPTTGKAADRRENSDLARALLTYAKTADAEDVSPFTNFLAEHPHSRWQAGLLVNLGATWRKTGRFPKAMDAFEETWNLTKNRHDATGNQLANWAVGELAAMHGHLGHVQRLNALLADLGDRDLHGPATEQVAGARESIWFLRNHPEDSYRCGPLSLLKIREYLHAFGAHDGEIAEAKASPQGMSLAQLAELAARAGMKLQMARRTPGSQIPLPAVMHWKVDHYSPILARQTEHGRDYYLVRNTHFERAIWISRATLDSESSGYFLVPEGPLPAGWRPVEEAESTAVLGRCSVSSQDNSQTMCYAPKVKKPCSGNSCTAGSPMAQYDFHAMLVSLNIMDQPVGYTPPIGPAVRFTVTYNEREALQPAIFTYSNLGPKWTFDWLSYIIDSGPGHGATVYLRGGGYEEYGPLQPSGNLPEYDYNYDYMSNARLVAKYSDAPTYLKPPQYERILPDGSKEIFTLPDRPFGYPRNIFLTQIVDPQGNAINLSYDAQMRVIAVTDAIGQVTTVSYGLPSDPLKVTKVTDPFGRSAAFSYSADGHLAKITDVIGITSEFTYGRNDFIGSLTTPYGVTNFRTGNGPYYAQADNVNQFIEATDPLGATERIEFANYAPGFQDLDLSNADINLGPDIGARRTFYWDKLAYRQAAGDYTQAQAYQWRFVAHTASGVVQYIKQPLEGRVMFNYSGVPPAGPDTPESLAGDGHAVDYANPRVVRRDLPGGTKQDRRFQYNRAGHVTQAIDPAGRTSLFQYDSNNIDLLRVSNGLSGETLASYTYNAQHLPLTYIDAAGQMTNYSYNARGQLLSVTNPKHETMTFTYDGNGYLIRVTGPIAGATDTFTYDRVGRLQSATDSEGYTVTIEYDLLDRPTKVAYPDGTFDQTVYDRLDPVRMIDRLGRATRIAYDALRRPISITDPLGRVTQLAWCNCGSLAQLTDPAGNVTTWTRDLQGRVIAKTLADGTQTQYVYDATTGRLSQVADANGQTTTFQYGTDDALQQITYSGANVSMPAVTLAYDPDYARLTSMQDGTGTTAYSYVPAGSLGALHLASVAHSPASASETQAQSTIAYSYDELGRANGRSIDGTDSRVSFDSLGRIIGWTNSLGSFTASYLRATGLLSGLTYPNSQTAAFFYFDNKGGQRLKQIVNQGADKSILSQFGYTYLATGEIQSLATLQKNYTFSYDAASQLTGAQVPGLGAYGYSYDAAGNRTAEQIDSQVNSAVYNATNELTQNAAQPFTYDANGNLLDDGARTFEWDAADRLTAVNNGMHRSEFGYDGQDRRTRIVEIESGAVVNEKQLIWCGGSICEERDSVTGVTKRFFEQGETQVSGGVETSYFYTRDHLGSVREMTDSSGAVVASYDYDPWGRSVKIFGNADASFGYAAYYVHAPSGLLLTVNRVYDPNLGRWFSRDPAGEQGGLNLYAYVNGNPIALSDPEGLDGGGGVDWLGWVKKFVKVDLTNPYKLVSPKIPTSPDVLPSEPLETLKLWSQLQFLQREITFNQNKIYELEQTCPPSKQRDREIKTRLDAVTKDARLYTKQALEFAKLINQPVNPYPVIPSRPDPYSDAPISWRLKRWWQDARNFQFQPLY
jgi:RHS repeat-associated protein